ncbi:hypothetical protein OAR07_01115 [Flavobacteriaceae bacterium]|nr:hypothetical protein [Flavobacteriaceae bacterium]
MGWDDQIEEWGDEVYKKHEVDYLLNEMYDSIMSEVEQRLSPNSKQNYYFNIHKTSFPHKKFILQKLYEYLISGGYIEEIEYKYFEIIFSGKEVEDNFTPIKWSKQENLCVYLFDLLEDFEIVSNINIPKKIGLLFGVANASQKRKYKENKEGKPTGYKPIEAIVNNIQKGLD